MPESTIFTQAVHGLFDVLGRGDKNTRPPLNLTIEVIFPEDAFQPPGYTEHFLRFVPINGHQKALTRLKNVDSFTISHTYRSVHPTAASSILAALPCVKSINIPLERRGPQPFEVAYLRIPPIHGMYNYLATAFIPVVETNKLLSC